jgi:hypothetical protein
MNQSARRLFFAVLVVGLTAVATPALAQDQGVGFGLLGGITRADFDSDGPTDFFESRNGWMAGLWFGGNRDGVLGFMGELSLVEKRAEGGGETIKLRYLEIPAVLRLNVGQRSRSGVSVYGMAGPVFDIKIGDEGFNIVDEYEGFDIGILAGGGIEITRIGFEVRGNWGLRQINGGDLADAVEIKTFTLQALVKVRIN